MFMSEVAQAVGMIQSYEEDPIGYDEVSCGGRRCAEDQVCYKHVRRTERRRESDRGGQCASSKSEALACASMAKEALISKVRSYRAEYGLPRIPISGALTQVAKTHVRDLARHGPHRKESQCNTHGWSDEGGWTPCCYTPDHARASCMWDKPREITDYEGGGFEIASGPGVSDAEDALSGWKSSPEHHAVLINEADGKATSGRHLGSACSRHTPLCGLGCNRALVAPPPRATTGDLKEGGGVRKSGWESETGTDRAARCTERPSRDVGFTVHVSIRN